MQKKYQLEGMSCENCVKHVKQVLLSIPGAVDVEVKLKPQSALLNMSKPIDLKDLQAQLDSVGNYIIKELIEAE